ITLVPDNAPAGEPLGGITTISAAGGIAVFSGLTLTRAASTDRFQAQSGSLAPASAGPFAVSPAPATQWVVTTPPPSVVPGGGAFGLVITAEDAFGNVDPTEGGDVVLSLASNPGGATLAGTLSVTAVAGVASAAGLSLDRAAAGYVLQAEGGGLTS